MKSLADAAARAAKGIRIKLYEPTPLPEIQKVLAHAPQGRARVTLCLDLDEEEAEMELTGAWHITEPLKASLRNIGNGLEVVEY